MRLCLITFLMIWSIHLNGATATDQNENKDFISKYENQIFTVIQHLESAKTENNKILISYYENKLIKLLNYLDEAKLTDQLAKKLF